MEYSDIKQNIYNEVSTNLKDHLDIVSLTFVGSFPYSNHISAISDIDVVIITKALNEKIFYEILDRFNSISLEQIGLGDRQLIVNSTFGPLKFDDPNSLVFHVMIYDIEGHRRHVLESPFTCLDWERRDAFFGSNLRDIYSAHGVQIDDLIGSRRGLKTYLEDLKNQKISYRRYTFQEEGYNLERKDYPIDKKLSIEFSFHTLKFLLINLTKILTQTNRRFEPREMEEFLVDTDSNFGIYFEYLKKFNFWKSEKNYPLNFDSIQVAFQFLEFLESWIGGLKMVKVDFVRHAKTSLNNGTFLGSKRDPGISVGNHDLILKKYNHVYSSALKRTIDTVHLLGYKQISTNPLLNEIDYGEAEGLDLIQLKDKFPWIIDSWNLGQDPRFPDGENQSDVLKRLLNFLEQLKAFEDGSYLVVTHNVVLRCLLGFIFKIEVKNWYQLSITHLERLEFLIYRGVLIPHLSLDQRTRFKDQVYS